MKRSSIPPYLFVIGLVFLSSLWVSGQSILDFPCQNTSFNWQSPNAQVEDLAVDSQGNVYIVGSFLDTLQMGGGMYITGNLGTQSGYVAKFDSTGAPIWGNPFSGSLVKGYQLLLGPNDEVYATMEFSDGAVVNGTYYELGWYQLQKEVLVIRMDTAGNIKRIHHRLGRHAEIALSPSGDVLYLGTFQNDIFFHAGDTLGTPCGNPICPQSYVALQAIDTTDQDLWLWWGGGQGGNEWPLSIDVNAQGTIGMTFIVTDYPVYTQGNIYTSGNGYGLAFFDQLGNLIELQDMRPNDNRRWMTVRNDTYGNWYVSGQINEPFLLGGGMVQPSQVNHDEPFVACLDGNYDFKWAVSLPVDQANPYWEYVDQLRWDPVNEIIYGLGRTWDDFSLGPVTVQMDYPTAYVFGLDTSGAMRYGKTAGDMFGMNLAVGSFPYGMAIDQDGHPLVSIDIPDSTWWNGQWILRPDSSSLSQLVIELCTGPLLSGDSQAQVSISLYPNPTSDRLQLRYPKGLFSQWEMYGMEGKVYDRGNISPRQQQTVVETSQLSNGVYMLAFRSEGHTLVRKVCIQH